MTGNECGQPVVSDTRFVDNGDGTVTDTGSGLMWCKTDSMNDLKKWVNYPESRDYVRTLRERLFAGYDDWRLPTRQEILSLYHDCLENKDAFGKTVHISGKFAAGCGLSMMAEIIVGRTRTFVMSLRDGTVNEPDGIWTISESARAVRNITPDPAP